MRFTLFIISGLALVLTSCGSKVKSKDELKASFKIVSEQLGEDTLAAKKFITDAQAFINEPNEDTNKVHFQKLISETYTMMGDYDKAIESWDLLRNTYVRHHLSAEALFKKAFLLSEMKGMKEASRPLYEEFLIKYPDHIYAESARFQISNLELNNNEVLHKIISDSSAKQ